MCSWKTLHYTTMIKRGIANFNCTKQSLVLILSIFSFLSVCGKASSINANFRAVFFSFTFEVWLINQSKNENKKAIHVGISYRKLNNDNIWILQGVTDSIRQKVCKNSHVQGDRLYMACVFGTL